MFNHPWYFHADFLRSIKMKWKPRKKSIFRLLKFNSANGNKIHQVKKSSQKKDLVNTTTTLQFLVDLIQRFHYKKLYFFSHFKCSQYSVCINWGASQRLTEDFKTPHNWKPEVRVVSRLSSALKDFVNIFQFTAFKRAVAQLNFNYQKFWQSNC